MKRYIFLILFTTISVSIANCTLNSMKLLDFKTIENHERIGKTIFHYQVFEWRVNNEFWRYRLKIVNDKTGSRTPPETNNRSDFKEVPADNYTKDNNESFKAARIERSEKSFIVTSSNTHGNGGFSSHEIFKISGNRIEYLGERMSCDDVKIEREQLIFTEYGYHCDRIFDDGETTTSSIDLN
jgi:hypothetical protein